MKTSRPTGNAKPGAAGRFASGGPSTLTHARLRAAQGDLSGARAILGVILRREPGNAAAARALSELADRRARVVRLRGWLRRIERRC